ncbi:uncharacterized protein LOC130666332 [Microplitis mediator]|uniref:uncharacterized protein LOC130666332 n=1 Tax=Microplitis mediator TaxID=375433 RepID=UPI0025548850|nr:uncharacterized protein LOC130666332 [Microplitis mediator]
MDKTPFFQSTFSKWEKILDKLPHRSYFKNDKDDKSKENLNGADGSGSNKNNNETSSKKSVTEDEVKSDKQHVDQTDSSQLNKYQEVDELINEAIENIQEAAAALANLAGSHEQELKMVIMNILVKFQDWIDGIQKKLNSTKNALNDLRWILATKDIELKVKTRELNELRQSITEYEQKKTRDVRPELVVSEADVLKPVDIEASAAKAGLVTFKPDLLEPAPGLIASVTPSQIVQSSTAVTHVTTISLSSSLKISNDHISQPEHVTAQHSVVVSVAKSTNAYSLGSKNASDHEIEVKNVHMALPVSSNTEVVDKNDNYNDDNKINFEREDKNLNNQQSRSRSSKPRSVPMALANISASQTIISDGSSGSLDRHTVLVDMSATEVPDKPVTVSEENKLVESEISQIGAPASTKISRPLSLIPEDRSSLTNTYEDVNRSPEAPRAFDASKLPDISALRLSILRASVDHENQAVQTSNQSIISRPSVTYEHNLSSQTNLQIPIKEKPVIINITQPRLSNDLDHFGRQSKQNERERKEDEGERDKREIKLIDKLSEIRKENEKLKKDKLRYESAVKNALFRGFLSLIDEDKLNGFKKQTICHAPCVPCNQNSSTSVKTTVPNIKVAENNRDLSSKDAKSRAQLSKKHANTYSSISKQCSQNTIYLSPLKNTDTCIAIPELYIQAENTGVKTICQGGKCSRPANYRRNTTKDIDKAQYYSKNFKVQRHVHDNAATGCNISPNGLQEYTRVMGCKNILTLQRHVN